MTKQKGAIIHFTFSSFKHIKRQQKGKKMKKYND